MKWINNLLNSLHGVSAKIPFLSRFQSSLEQGLEGFVAFAFVAILTRYLPIISGAHPVLAAAFPAIVVAALTALGTWLLGSKYKVGIAVFTVLSVFFYFLSQPLILLLLSGIIGIAAAVAAAVKVKGRVALRIGATIGALIVAPLATAAACFLMWFVVLPLVHPSTQWTNAVGPLISNIPTVLILAYAAIRQRSAEPSKYWLAMPVLSTLFAICFFPTHSYVGMFVVTATALALSVYAYLERPTEDGPGRPVRPFCAAVVVVVAFSGLFVLSNSWQWLHDYQEANAITVTQIDVAQMPATEPNRQVPIVAAGDYCRTNNQEQVTTISTSPFPLIVKENGVDQFYWECLRHPDYAALNKNPGQYLTNLTAITGGVDGAVLVNAGDRGRYGEPITTNFVFGDQSPLAIGAFYARHPGATRYPGMIALTADGSPYFIMPFTNKVLQDGAMIPALSGVMVISPWGFIQDMLPSQAAATFPGVHFMPSELVHEYAAVWGRAAHSLRKLVDASQQLELSEFPNTSGNEQPFWEEFKAGADGKGAGQYGVLYFEPQGTQANSWVRIGLFDRAQLAMTIVHTEGLDLTGPKQLTAGAAAASHIGLNQVTAIDPLLQVSPNHCIYVLTALMQQVNAAYHGYSLNNLADGHGHNYIDVRSRSEIEAAMAQGEAGGVCPGAHQ